jgi:ferredoxin
MAVPFLVSIIDRYLEQSLMKTYTVTLVNPEGVKQTCVTPEDQYIIDAANEAGIDLPYACRTGACLSCAGKIIQGSIDQSDQNYLTPSQLSANYVLLCVVYPKSDCIIQTHKEDDCAGASLPGR